MSLFTESVPWFLPLLFRVLAVLTLWLLLCVPAYLLLPYLRALGDAARSSVTNLTARIREIRRERRQARFELAQRVAVDYADKAAVDTRSQRWRAAVADIAAPLTDLTARFGQLSTRIAKVARSSEVVLPLGGSAVPSAEDLRHEIAEERLAWMNLIFSSVVLIASIAVNIAMLSQILRDLELIPEELHFASLPLTSVFAALLTVVEAGIGFLHSAAREHAAKSDRSLSVGVIATFAAAATIAFVEGFFYSRIGSIPGDKKLIFDVPFLGTQTTWESVFFLWGFVLVMTLFAFGLLFHRATATIVRFGTARRLAANLKRLNRTVVRGNTDLERLRGSLAAIEDESIKAQMSVKTTADRTIDLRRQLQAEADAPQAMEAARSGNVSSQTVRQQCLTVLWVGMAISATVMLWRLSQVGLWGLGLALVAAVCGIAFAVRPVELVENFRLRRRPLVLAAVAVMVAALTIGTYIYSRLAIMTGLALALFAISGELSRLLGFIGLWAAVLRDGGSALLEGAALVVAYAVLMATNAITFVTAIVASPFGAVMRRRSPG